MIKTVAKNKWNSVDIRCSNLITNEQFALLAATGVMPYSKSRKPVAKKLIVRITMIDEPAPKSDDCTPTKGLLCGLHVSLGAK